MCTFSDLQDGSGGEDQEQRRQNSASNLVELESVHRRRFPLRPRPCRSGSYPRSGANIEAPVGLATELAPVLGALPEANCHFLRNRKN
jgi:hypothetical protein